MRMGPLLNNDKAKELLGDAFDEAQEVDELPIDVYELDQDDLDELLEPDWPEYYSPLKRKAASSPIRHCSYVERVRFTSPRQVCDLLQSPVDWNVTPSKRRMLHNSFEGVRPFLDRSPRSSPMYTHRYSLSSPVQPRESFVPRSVQPIVSRPVYSPLVPRKIMYLEDSPSCLSRDYGYSEPHEVPLYEDDLDDLLEPFEEPLDAKREPSFRSREPSFVSRGSSFLSRERSSVSRESSPLSREHSFVSREPSFNSQERMSLSRERSFNAREERQHTPIHHRGQENQCFSESKPERIPNPVIRTRSVPRKSDRSPLKKSMYIQKSREQGSPFVPKPSKLRYSSTADDAYPLKSFEISSDHEVEDLEISVKHSIEFDDDDESEKEDTPLQESRELAGDDSMQDRELAGDDSMQEVAQNEDEDMDTPLQESQELAEDDSMQEVPQNEDEDIAPFMSIFEVASPLTDYIESDDEPSKDSSSKVPLHMIDVATELRDLPKDTAEPILEHIIETRCDQVDLVQMTLEEMVHEFTSAQGCVKESVQAIPLEISESPVEVFDEPKETNKRHWYRAYDNYSPLTF